MMNKINLNALFFWLFLYLIWGKTGLIWGIGLSLFAGFLNSIGPK